MAPIFEEIEVKDEPWLHSSEYDQVSYGVQVYRFFFSHQHYDIVAMSIYDLFPFISIGMPIRIFLHLISSV